MVENALGDANSVISSKRAALRGKVLVYCNPGLHFGDILVLNATYVEALETKVGNSKYAIFFPTSGLRSLADEIAGGDFDGDMYWVSRSPQVGICIRMLGGSHFPSKRSLSGGNSVVTPEVQPSEGKPDLSPGEDPCTIKPGCPRYITCY
ncbi:probable RNA-dependent RNA polymerase 5 [Eucalyptus grandis]|uniref:probable RNA-dependent RNA polymerase 5 n=1 Tax=Eucalyptus grandis TaxID=71139 RepID=UPI00192EC62D|nr:probable RNA-dependent RNA polymerase 5 [Eucalyptus grandis]XP_039174118.1 probable RNA-dependent RNA polymerase 5 [Eucalyptus grandis]